MKGVPMKKQILAAVCFFAVAVLAVGCSQAAVSKPSVPSDTGEGEITSRQDVTTQNTSSHNTSSSTTACATTSSDSHEKEENTDCAQREAYLAGVNYRRYALTGENEPFYIGRWFEKEIGGVSHRVTLTDGSYFCFLIEGAAFFDVNFTVITTGEEPYFAYSIDGAEPVRRHITDSTVMLPDTGRHTVRVIADGMTEGEGKWEKEKGFALRSVVPSEGGLLFGIRPTEKVIFFYGDSITEGVRALNMSATSNGNSATGAYAWKCAEALGVTPYLIGYGATGILSKGSFHTMKNAIDYISEGRPVGDGVIPDVIVVNHGTNDGRYSAEQFASALAETLAHLRAKYPEAPIVYLIPFSGTHAETIRLTVKNIENAYIVETAGWEISYTDRLHPDVAGAETAGQLLAVALKDLFGEDYFRSSD